MPGRPYIGNRRPFGRTLTDRGIPVARLDRRFGLRLVALSAALAFAAWLPPAQAPAAQAQGGEVRMEWLGWSFFRFTSSNSTTSATSAVGPEQGGGDGGAA